MRTQAQLLDITNRSKCGYALLVESLTTIRENDSMTGNNVKPTYDKLLHCLNLIHGISFKALTLTQQNLFADKLVRAGIVVVNEVGEYYVNPDYSDYVNFSQ